MFPFPIPVAVCDGGDACCDMCGVCDADDDNNCVQDCEEAWGGSATTDGCGECFIGDIVAERVWMFFQFENDRGVRTPNKVLRDQLRTLPPILYSAYSQNNNNNETLATGRATRTLITTVSRTVQRILLDSGTESDRQN